MWKSAVLNFTQTDKEIWEIQAHTDLHTAIKYDFTETISMQLKCPGHFLQKKSYTKFHENLTKIFIPDTKTEKGRHDLHIILVLTLQKHLKLGNKGPIKVHINIYTNKE
jgi:hypothetical protein